MKVVAIKEAFYNGRRVRVGAELEVPEGIKGSWFAPTASTQAKALKAEQARPKREEPKALSELGTVRAKSFVDIHAKAAPLA